MLRPITEMYQGKYPDELLVGLDMPDDAAAWLVEPDRALLFTTDFFTPVVDDPYEYGAIAAANSISDIYAMGGDPFMALSIAAFPPDLPVDIGEAIMKGAVEKAQEAGVVIAGGHTVQDKEPKFGLAVLGFAHPYKMIRKKGAEPGDKLVLTKPLGFGVTTTAIKQGIAEPQDIQEVIKWMLKLNATASKLAVEHKVYCGTDVTGYSLIGHAMELAQSSRCKLHLHFSQIPFISCARKYAEKNAFPGGAADNKLFYEKSVNFEEGIDEWDQLLLFDPQTSGGLLLCVPENMLSPFLLRARNASQPVWVIGDVEPGEPGIEVSQI